MKSRPGTGGNSTPDGSGGVTGADGMSGEGTLGGGTA